jgi:alcohol dehydrogenase
MRAVVFEEFGGPVNVRSVSDPAPSPGGVVVEVRATGLCRSDWHAWAGHDEGVALPHVPVTSSSELLPRWAPTYDDGPSATV